MVVLTKKRCRYHGMLVSEIIGVHGSNMTARLSVRFRGRKEKQIK